MLCILVDGYQCFGGTCFLHLLWNGVSHIPFYPEDGGNKFYDRMTDFLWIKPTDALNSNFIGITTLHVSGSLSAHHQEFLAIHRLWYMEFHPTPGSRWSSWLHKMYQSRCTAKNSWWWAERLPETCRVVIPIKLEFSASTGFIHKDWKE